MSRERFAVIGDPIDHSLSPVMQNAAFRAAGVDAEYDAVRVGSVHLAEWFDAARSTYRGFNVTIPHKEDAARLMDTVDEVAHYVDAVNTVSVEASQLIGSNTDVPGFTATVQTLGVPVDGREVVVFGAGGSARAVVWALLRMQARVTIINRTLARSQTLADAFIGAAPNEVERPLLQVLGASGPETADAVSRAALLVNTTPLGMAHLAGNPLPGNASLAHRPGVIDLVYGQETPFVTQAREAGCAVTDGIEMLVQQGAASFRIWTGAEPDLDVMRNACRTEVEERRECYVF